MDVTLVIEHSVASVGRDSSHWSLMKILMGLILLLCSSCGPIEASGLVGVSGSNHRALSIWLPPCPLSHVTSLGMFRSYVGFDPEHDKPLWQATFAQPLAGGVGVDLVNPPDGTIETGPILDAIGSDQIAIGIIGGTSGALGVGYTTFRPEQLRSRSVLIDGKRLSPDQYLKATSPECR